MDVKRNKKDFIEVMEQDMKWKQLKENEIQLCLVNANYKGFIITQVTCKVYRLMGSAGKQEGVTCIQNLVFEVKSNDSKHNDVQRYEGTSINGQLFYA